MKDILGKEIVSFKEALYLKTVGFNGECTGYYHCDDYLSEEGLAEDARYECVGWRGLFRNSYSRSRAAAPTVRAAKMWYTKHKIRPFDFCGNQNTRFMDIQTLKLVLKKKWYDMIASGEKKEEYREISDYYKTRIDNITTRLCSVDSRGMSCMESLYSPVTFYLGYSKDRPSMTFRIKNIRIGEGKSEWGAEPQKKYFVIELGERINEAKK